MASVVTKESDYHYTMRPQVLVRHIVGGSNHISEADFILGSTFIGHLCVVVFAKRSDIYG